MEYPELDQLEENVLKQGNLVRILKAEGKDVKQEVEKLLNYKSELLSAVTKTLEDVEAKVKSGAQDLQHKLNLLLKKKEELTPNNSKKKQKKKPPAQKNVAEKPKEKSGELSKKEKNKLERKQRKKNAKENVQSEPSKTAKPYSPPHLALLTAKLNKLELFIDDDFSITLKHSSGKKGMTMRGNTAPARYFTRTANCASELYPQDKFEVCYEVDLWLEQYERLESVGENELQLLDKHLGLHTYIVGYGITLADLLVFCKINANPQSRALAKQFPHVCRWNSMMMSIPLISSYFEENLASKTKEKSFPRKQNETLPEGLKEVADCPPLEGVKLGDSVVTRFPPEPSGHLHIGHAKAIFLNKYYAQRYNGKMLVRFDDTNPSKEKEEYEQGILEDLKALDIIAAKVSWTSDHFDSIFKYAEQLIKQGDAYMDNTKAERMRIEREEGTESVNRNNTVEKNLELWREMQKGSEEGRKWCLRAKMDMKSMNKCMRDPVFYRSNLTPHARTKTRYKAYPTYDLACPIVDSIEGVTHVLRDMNYRDRKPMYEWVLQKLKLRSIHLHDFARLNFVYVLMSKRKLAWFVEQGKVEDWSDPRFPTVKGILRRGLQVKALFNFMVAQGASKKETDMEWDKIWNLNKKIIDPVVPRYMAVNLHDHVEIQLDDVKHVIFKTVPRHPKDIDGSKHGLKTLFITPKIVVEQSDLQGVENGEQILLLQIGCVNITETTYVDGVLKSARGRRDPSGDVKLPKRKIHWIPISPHTVKAKIFEFDYLITKKKLDENDDFKDFLNPNTVATTEVIASPGLRLLKEGDCLQLLRRGYYRVDKPFASSTQEIHLFTIPDGKAKSISTFQTTTEKMKHR